MNNNEENIKYLEAVYSCMDNTLQRMRDHTIKGDIQIVKEGIRQMIDYLHIADRVTSKMPDFTKENRLAREQEFNQRLIRIKEMIEQL